MRKSKLTRVKRYRMLKPENQDSNYPLKFEIEGGASFLVDI